MRLGHKYFIATAILLFVITGMVFAQGNPTITKVESFDGYIRVEWTLNPETGVDHYEVWRSSGSSIPIFIGIVPRGFFYLDDKNGLYKTADQYFSYQVKAIGSNPSLQGKSESVGIRYTSPNSTYKRTWGSIKAMFR
jgi:hypothetical protein